MVIGEQGRFAALDWSKLEASHSASWSALQKDFNLFAGQIAPTSTLDDLAAQCIHTCRDILFTDGDTCRIGWQTHTAAGIMYLDDLERHLTLALQDHLIVTFAHRFYCDNFAPVTQEDYLLDYYLTKVFESRSDIRQESVGLNGKGQADGDNERKTNFFKTKRGPFEQYAADVRAYADFQRNLFSSTEPVPEEGDIVAELLAPPNWLFSIAMACGHRIKHPLAIVDGVPAFLGDYERKKNLLLRLTKFLTDNEWGPLLFAQSGSDSRRMLPFDVAEPRLLTRTSSEIELRTSGGFFVGIPSMPDNTYNLPLPPQKYRFKGGSETVEISPEVQHLFNSYLAERTFHTYAILEATEGVMRHRRNGVFEGRQDQCLQLPAMIRVQAPLVHGPLIQIAAYVVQQTRPWVDSMNWVSWINGLVNRWNHTALPVLEELFVWAAYKQYSFNSLPKQITDSLAGGEASQRRCHRLNLYRLVPVTKNHSGEVDRHGDPIVNKLFAAGYAAGLGVPIWAEEEVDSTNNPGKGVLAEMLAREGKQLDFGDTIMKTRESLREKGVIQSS